MVAILKIIFSNSLNCFIIRTLHDCPSQMNDNSLISNSKLTSSFMRDSHVGCVLHNDKDNRWPID